MPVTFKKGNAVSALIDGEIRDSRNFGKYKIITAVSPTEYLIEFIRTGYTCVVRKSNLIKGEVKDKLLPVVCNVGYIGCGEYDSKHISYYHWYSMIKRCYSVLSDGSNKAYLDKGVVVSEEWHDFQNFAKWFQDYIYENKINYTKHRYNLDKDILGTGLLYSPNNCCVVPEIINNFHKDLYHAKGCKPNKSKSKPYTVSISGKWVKDFRTEEEAIQYYGYEKCKIFKKIMVNMNLNNDIVESFVRLFKLKFNVDFDVIVYEL